MKVRLFLLGFVSAGLCACGGDKRLLVGEELVGVGGGAGSGGTGFAGGTNGASGSGGSSIGGGGTGPDNGGMGPGPGPGPGPSPSQECLDMAREYKSLLRSAQVCMPPAPSTPDPCTRQMPDDLLCRCPTFVNPDRSLDIPYLEYLIAETADCPRTCEPNSCRQVTSGVCMLDQNLDPPRPHCFAVP